MNDVSVAGDSGPTTDRQVDLSHEVPKKSRSEEAPVKRVPRDEVRMHVEMHIGVKGALHRPAEYLVLCAATSITAVAGAGVCRIAGVPAWLTALAALALAVAAFCLGYRHITVLGSQSRLVMKEK